MTELDIATPVEIATAWEQQFNGPDRALRYVISEFQAHPVPFDVIDPIYHRESGQEESGGWRLARDIKNLAAMREMEQVLHAKGLALPPEVTLAWAATRERDQWRSDVYRAVVESLNAALPEAAGVRDVLDKVIADLEAMRFHLGDVPVEPPELPEEVDLDGPAE